MNLCGEGATAARTENYKASQGKLICEGGCAGPAIASEALDLLSVSDMNNCTNNMAPIMIIGAKPAPRAVASDPRSPHGEVRRRAGLGGPALLITCCGSAACRDTCNETRQRCERITGKQSLAAAGGCPSSARSALAYPVEPRRKHIEQKRFATCFYTHRLSDFVEFESALQSLCVILTIYRAQL